MKALTDKIIDELKNRSKGYIGTRANKKAWAKNKGYKIGLRTAIEIVKTLEASATFEEIARVVMKHLANPEKYHPFHRVYIDSTFAELLEGKKTTGKVMDYITDTDGLSNAISGPVEGLTSFPSMDCHSYPLSELTPLTYVECHGNTSAGSIEGLRIMKKEELMKKQSELIDMQGMFISYFRKYSGDSERIDRFSKQIAKIQEEIASLIGKPEKL